MQEEPKNVERVKFSKKDQAVGLHQVCMIMETRVNEGKRKLEDSSRGFEGKPNHHGESSRPTKKRRINSIDEEKKRIKETLASKWATILSDGLLENVRRGILSEYKTTGTFKFLGAPAMNSELKFLLDDNTLKRDEDQACIQNQLGSTLVGIGNMISSGLTCNRSKIDVDVLIDVAIIIADVQHKISLQRRSAVISAFELGGMTDISTIKKDLFGLTISNILRSTEIKSRCNEKDCEEKNISEEMKKTNEDSNNNNVKKNELNVEKSNINSKSDKEASQSEQKSEDKTSKDVHTLTEGTLSIADKHGLGSGIPTIEKKAADGKEMNDSESAKKPNEENSKQVENCTKESSPVEAKSVTESRTPMMEKKKKEDDETNDSVTGLTNLKENTNGNKESQGDKTNNKVTESDDKTKHIVEEVVEIFMNKSIHAFEELDATYKKKIEALQLDEQIVKPEKQVTDRIGPVEPFPGIQAAHKLKFIAEGHGEKGAETMSHALLLSTLKGYERPVRFWWEYCRKKNIDVHRGSDINIVQFFIENESNIGLPERVQSWRTALGAVLIKEVDHQSQNSSVAKYIKGLLNESGGKIKKK